MAPNHSELPSAPREIPKYIREPIQKQSPSRLRLISEYAEKLANAKEQQQERELDSEEDEDSEEDSQKNVEQRDEDTDLPEGVPAKASITTKEINNNHYYYWQWRDGDEIKSKYKGPVNPN